MYFLKTGDGSSVMNIDNWNIHFDESTTSQILNYLRKIIFFPDSIEKLIVDGVEDYTLSYVSVVFDDMILSIDNISMYILSEADLYRALSSLEDLVNDSDIVF